MHELSPAGCPISTSNPSKTENPSVFCAQKLRSVGKKVSAQTHKSRSDSHLDQQLFQLYYPSHLFVVCSINMFTEQILQKDFFQCNAAILFCKAWLLRVALLPVLLPNPALICSIVTRNQSMSCNKA